MRQYMRMRAANGSCSTHFLLFYDLLNKLADKLCITCEVVYR